MHEGARRRTPVFTVSVGFDNSVRMFRKSHAKCIFGQAPARDA
jgi:hypothetical protein